LWENETLTLENMRGELYFFGLQGIQASYSKTIGLADNIWYYKSPILAKYSLQSGCMK
jgi:hypothetical protein